MTADEIKELISQGEGPHLEFKTRFASDKFIARHIGAFANSGGGTIIFGVSDKGGILGLSPEEEKEILYRLKRIGQQLLPIFVYSHRSIQVDGKSLVYMHIDEAPASDRPIRLATGDTLAIRDGVTIEVTQAQRAVSPLAALEHLLRCHSERKKNQPLWIIFEQCNEPWKRPNSLSNYSELTSWKETTKYRKKSWKRSRGLK